MKKPLESGSMLRKRKARERNVPATSLVILEYTIPASIFANTAMPMPSRKKCWHRADSTIQNLRSLLETIEKTTRSMTSRRSRGSMSRWSFFCKEGLGTLQVISEVIARVLRVMLFLVLWNKFVLLVPLKDKTERHRIEMLSVLLIAEEIVIGLLYSGTFPLATTVSFAIVLFYVIPWRKEDVRETIFSCMLYLNLRFLSYFAVNTLLELISNPIMDAGLKSDDIENFVVKWVDVLYLLTNFFYVIMIALLLLPILFMVRKRIRMGWSEAGYLSVMNIAGVVLTRTIMSIAIFQTAEKPVILVEERPQLFWQLPLIGLLLYLGELSAIFIWQRYDMWMKWIWMSIRNISMAFWIRFRLTHHRRVTLNLLTLQKMVGNR